MKEENIIGSFQLMKSLNKSLILNTIRIHGAISRAEIAKKTKLTPPTVTNIVNELLKEGLVKEGQPGASNGGRKPILLKINGKNFFVMAVDISSKKIRFAITDLDAHILLYKTVNMKDPITNEQFLQTIIKQIYFMLDEAKVDLQKFVGIGIGMHGIIDAKAGISIYAPGLQLRHIPLKAELENEFKLPVKLENDVRAMALGESWFGSGKGINSLVCLNVGNGAGAGFIVDNKIFRGYDGLAGEIGHMFIGVKGPRCSCGRYGCLESIVGSEGLKYRALNKILLGYKTKIIEMAEGNLENVNGAMIYEAALAGDSLAINILTETGRYLGLAITNIIHLINPKRIVIGGGLAKAKDFILAPIREVIEERSLTEQAKKTEIALSEFGEKATVIGAAALVLSELFTVQYDSVS